MPVENLQDRVDQMAAGETLRLEPARHEFKGPVKITKAIRIEGQGGTIWATTGPVVSIEIPGVELCDLNIEITSRDVDEDGDASCALMVGPLVDIKLDNVTVRGNVVGLQQEEGVWKCPRNLQLGSLRSALAHQFALKLVTPVACTLESQIDGLEIAPHNLPGGPANLTVRLDPLPTGTRLRGELLLRTQRLTRRIPLSGQIRDDGNTGNGQYLWRPKGETEPIVVVTTVPVQPNRSVPLDPARTTPPSAVLPTSSSQPIVSQPSSSEAFIVSPFDGRFRTIGEALQMAPTGARITIKPGVYKETLKINKKVELVGDGPVADIVVESPDGNALVLRCDLAKVHGITLRNATGSSRHRHAVHVPQGHLVLDECRISSGSLACVAVTAMGATVLLKRCRIGNGSSAGILVCDKGEAQVEDCDILEHALSGAECRRGGHLTLRGCRISACRHAGVLIHDGGKASIEDCDIQGNELAGVDVRHNGIPSVRRCKIHHGRGPGLRVVGTSQVTMEECEVFENGTANLEIRQGGAPVIRRCQLRAAKHAGAVFTNDAQGTMEECTIVDNQKSGVEISQNANPTLRRCTIRNCGAAGLVVRNRGRGLLEECDLSEAEFAIMVVRQNSTPVLRRCKITGSKRAGVLAMGAGGGTLEDCEVFAHGGPGVIIAGDSNPALNRCRIYENGQAGVVVWDNGRGQLDHCEITANGLSGLAILAGATPSVTGCKITQNRDAGVWAQRKAEGSVQSCDLTGNRGGAADLEFGADTELTDNREEA
jgi:F-box protein 11